MIRVKFHTNLDKLKGATFPQFLTCKPAIDERVITSKGEGRICAIAHGQDNEGAYLSVEVTARLQSDFRD